MRKSTCIKKYIVATKTDQPDRDGPLAGPKEDGARTVERSVARKCSEMQDSWNAI